MSKIYKALQKAEAIRGLSEDHMAESIMVNDLNEQIDKRKDKRYSKRLAVKINSESLLRSGIMRDVSENGMFVVSSRDFTKDMEIDIEMSLSNNKTFFLKGTIIRNTEITGSNWLTGFGIKLREKDETFYNFLTTLT